MPYFLNFAPLFVGEEEEDDPDFDPSKVKPGQGAQECKQQQIRQFYSAALRKVILTMDVQKITAF